MRKKMNAVVISSVFLIFIGMSLFAAEHARTGYEGMVRYLGLSAAQVAAIDREVENFEKAQHPAITRLSQFEAQMERAIESGDADTIGRLSLDRIALNRQINEDRKSMQNRIRSILSPQQADKLDRTLEILRIVGIDGSVIGPLRLGASEGEIPVRIGEEAMRSHRTSESIMQVPGGEKIMHSHPKDNIR